MYMGRKAFVIRSDPYLMGITAINNGEGEISPMNKIHLGFALSSFLVRLYSGS